MSTSFMDPAAVVVPTKCLESTDPRDLVYGNVLFVNLLFEQHLRPEEISRDALRSYYVDLMLAQLRNGGFSQLVHNTRVEAELLSHLREGLARMSTPLRTREGLVGLEEEALHAEARRRGAALPDRGAREAAARAAAPRYVKLADALCGAMGRTLGRVTAGRVRRIGFRQRLVWTFTTTDGGRFGMVDRGKTADALDDGMRRVARIDARGIE